MMLFILGIIVGVYCTILLTAPTLERGEQALAALRPFANAGVRKEGRSPKSTVFGQPLVGDGPIALVEDFIQADRIINQ